MMGKDIWAFLLYFGDAISSDNALKFGKSSLSVTHESSNAIAELRADDADKRKLVATLSSTGKDYKKLRMSVNRVTPNGFELVEVLGEFGKDGGNQKESTWAPTNRSGAELLWIFHAGIFSRHGPLKDAIEKLGGKVNRSLFADAGQRQMDDFILADDENMRYKVELVMERHFGSHVNDSTTMKYARAGAADQKRQNKSKEVDFPRFSTFCSTTINLRSAKNGATRV